jgi:hypothetical protein
MTCCEYHGVNCNQGRACPARIAGLHTNDGGVAFSGGIAFPIEAEDEPPASPDDAQGWAVWSQLFLAAVTLACVAGVALAYLKS